MKTLIFLICFDRGIQKNSKIKSFLDIVKSSLVFSKRKGIFITNCWNGEQLPRLNVVLIKINVIFHVREKTNNLPHVFLARIGETKKISYIIINGKISFARYRW